MRHAQFATMGQNIIYIFADVLFWMLTWLAYIMIKYVFFVRCRICHRIWYYRNRVLTYRDGTQRTVKTHPCGSALMHSVYFHVPNSGWERSIWLRYTIRCLLTPSVNVFIEMTDLICWIFVLGIKFIQCFGLLILWALNVRAVCVRPFFV